MLVSLLTIENRGSIYRLFDGRGQLTLDGETFTGSELFVEISEITHPIETINNEMSITLNGASDTIVSLALVENYQNQSVKYEIVSLDDDMTVNFRKTRFEGYVSHAEVNDRKQGEDIVSRLFL